MTDIQYIFVGGAARSGTTMIQNMLDSHPDILGGPEFLYLPEIIALRNKLQNAFQKEWIDAYCNAEFIDDEIKKFINAYFHRLTTGHTIKFFSEKTPGNILVFSDLMKLFPSAYFIQVIRDPRATINSLLQVGQRGKKMGWKTQDFTHNHLSAVQYIKKSFRSGELAFQTNPEKILTLSYEHLVTDPKKGTREMCNFLDLEWSEKMIYPSEQKHMGEKALTNVVWYDRNSYSRNPQTDRMHKWKNELSSHHQVAITKLFKDDGVLKSLEYKINTDHLSPYHRFLGSLHNTVTSKLRPKLRKLFISSLGRV